MFLFSAQRQHNVNEGRCGICGDAWDTPTPRENEDGGLYGTRRVYRTYSKVITDYQYASQRRLNDAVN